MSDPLTFTYISADLRPDDGDGLHHGVHMECQQSSEFVMTACGRLMDPSEYTPVAEDPLCPDCWVDRCPRCGVPLKKEPH